MVPKIRDLDMLDRISRCLSEVHFHARVDDRQGYYLLVSVRYFRYSGTLLIRLLFLHSVLVILAMFCAPNIRAKDCLKVSISVPYF